MSDNKYTAKPEARSIRYVIKNPNGTYFACMTGIGPCFGATKDDCWETSSRKEAEYMAHSSWKFAGCEVEETL